MKPSVGGVPNDQTLSRLCLDAGFLEYFLVVGCVGAHQHSELVGQLLNSREICCAGSSAEVNHHEVRFFVPIELSEVRENVGVGEDVAEPTAQKRELRLPQAIQETILRENGAFIFILDLRGKNGQKIKQ